MRRLILLLGLTGTAACGPGTAKQSPPPGPAEPRTLTDPRTPRPGKLRILLSHDMEGLAGQDDWRTFQASQPEPFRRGQAMLADDVNAVIEGLFAGGATAVEVFDQHGSGQPDSIPDLPPTLLDHRAKQVFMSEAISAEHAARGDYDAVVTVAGHGATGSGGFAAHTFTLGIEIALNGLWITEAELIGYQWGQFGVPLIFATGDDALCKALTTSPWIECGATKRGTSVSTAELRPVAEVHEEMRTKARRAVERLAESKVMGVTTPVRITVGAVPPATLGLVGSLPGMEANGQRVTFTAPDLGPKTFEQLAGIVMMIDNQSRHQLLLEQLSASGSTRGVKAANDSAYFARWLALEKPR